MAQRGDYLVTIGIKPTSPETGYGYIEQGVPKAVIRGEEIFEVRSVREKPDLEQAKKLLEQGRFSWNSGMFVWKTTTNLDAIKQWLPDLYQGLVQIEEVLGSAGEAAVIDQVYRNTEAISIDYGVMEKTRTPLRCVASLFSWTDVGGWPAMWDFLTRDARGNATRGDVKAVDASGNLVFCEMPDETVALIGVDDLIIVRSGNRTLVARKDQVDRLKELGEI
jgi:mannose-1-phosphate guanylyltransferase